MSEEQNTAPDVVETPVVGGDNPQVTDTSGNATPPVEPVKQTEPQQKSSKDYIIERKDSKISKLQAQLEKAGISSNDDDDRIDQAVNNRIGDSLDFVKDLKLGNDVDNFIYNNKHFADRKDEIIQYAKSKDYRNLSIESIAYIVAGKDLLGIGANLKAQADAKISTSRVGGQSLPVKTNDYANMSDEEFDKSVARARSNY